MNGPGRDRYLDALGAAAHSNQEINQEIIQEEMWTQMCLLGIPDKPTYITLVGRGPFNDPIITIEYARRNLAEKKRRA